MKEHFVETTGSPRWKAISTLLSCAPAIQFCSEKTDNKTTLLSMQPDKIRQRLVRWLSEGDKLQQRTIRRLGELVGEQVGEPVVVLVQPAPDITITARLLKRAYCQWRRQIEGKGPGRPRRPSPDILRATQTQKGADLSRFFPEILIVIPS
jgi:hypothetical protein